MERRKILNSVLVKPTGSRCNLDCTYCFYLKKAELYGGQKLMRMSEDVLRQMVKQVMRQGGKQVSFGWQGGEPTLMGIPFFERAVEYQVRFGRAGQIVGNGLQTNGVLIDKEWAHFLRDTQFLVGLSLDGPAHVHDKYRRFATGKPSWQHAVRARDTLLNMGVEVNAIVVVNDYSVNYAQEIYDYHKNSGLTHMQFIPCLETHADEPSRSADFSVAADAYGNFLCDIFALWVADFKNGLPTTSIRWFDSLFYTYVGYEAPECTLLPECGVYVVVEHNGDVYSCDFYVEPNWHLGNIMNNDLDNMLNSPRQQEFGKLKSQLPSECRSCRWLTHCYGGCPKDRQRDPADHGSNHFCRSYIQFFKNADATLAKLADEWRERQQV
ncbi:anaerobic sulfatase maturase [candidate division KSB1 bacterium]|nr:anaerobic sulfatase maturase [candidate division KSB1 bacterium]